MRGRKSFMGAGSSWPFREERYEFQSSFGGGTCPSRWGLPQRLPGRDGCAEPTVICRSACARAIAVVLITGADCVSGEQTLPARAAERVEPVILTDYHPQDVQSVRFSPTPENPLTAWKKLLAQIQDADDRTKLLRVNLFFNLHTAFVDDLIVWQQPDYWATLLETLKRGAGDCEDFAIAKYATLRRLGIADEQLRLIYVRAGSGPSGDAARAHMVLGYYPTADAEPQILDNLTNEIRDASRRSDLSPIFSFNGAGLWVQGTTMRASDPTSRLSRWRDVLQRMHVQEAP